jgi:hypothetical protein
MGTIADAMTDDSTKPIDCLLLVSECLSKLNSVLLGGSMQDVIQRAKSKLLLFVVVDTSRQARQGGISISHQ